MQNEGKSAWGRDQHWRGDKNRLLLRVSCFSGHQWEATEDFKQVGQHCMSWLYMSLPEFEWLLIPVSRAIKHMTNSCQHSGADSFKSLFYFFDICLFPRAQAYGVLHVEVCSWVGPKNAGCSFKLGLLSLLSTSSNCLKDFHSVEVISCHQTSDW